jgi:hypothetical protein
VTGSTSCRHSASTGEGDLAVMPSGLQVSSQISSLRITFAPLAFAMKVATGG